MSALKKKKRKKGVSYFLGLLALDIENANIKKKKENANILMIPLSFTST